MWLMLSGFKVAEAANGREALEQVRHHRPDMVLMDLSMPLMDGVEAIRRLRSDASTADLPIIALSALGTDEAARQAHEAGANAYVQKPVPLEELLRYVENTFQVANEDGP
jgi:chemosensory pili system protein ChpA (sensor histidine kinase/response regulator)